MYKFYALKVQKYICLLLVMLSQVSALSCYLLLSHVKEVKTYNCSNVTNI
jgi:hypothetical protein